MKPLAPISPTARVALGILFFVLFVAAWSFATLGGYVSKTFLADPITMVEEGYDLLTKHGFLGDIAITIWRVLGGFVLAALGAVRGGFLAGGVGGGAHRDSHGRLKADRGFSRAVRLVRALLAGLRFHPV